MFSPLLTSRRGFSILMALGSIGVLLIIVVGLASIFLTDMRLSRLQYDSILSSTQAEGAFEYAMLKVKNHRDGFADAMSTTSLDAVIFSGSSPRTDKVQVNYSIEAQATEITFSGGNDNYTIFPLFTGTCNPGDKIDTTSCSPLISMSTIRVKEIINLSTTGNPDDLSWSIVAQSGSENISLSGTGEIDGLEIGAMRIQKDSCYDSNGTEKPLTTSMNSDGSCPDQYSFVGGGEVLTYFYDITGSTKDFLSNTPSSAFADMITRDPYILIYSSGSSADITLKTDAPFTLPELQVTTEARKGDALQSIRFTEDKSKYYDALKYGVYNTSP